jgi:hypothetical protein
MAATAAPVYITDAVLKLRTPAGSGTWNDFACVAKSATLTPKPGDETTYRTLCEDGTYTRLGRTTWTLDLAGVQDWSSTGLARFLAEHDGDEGEWFLSMFGAEDPTDDTPAYTGTCRLVAVAYGGEADAFAEYDVSLPVQTVSMIVDAASLPAGLTPAPGA